MLAKNMPMLCKINNFRGNYRLTARYGVSLELDRKIRDLPSAAAFARGFSRDLRRRKKQESDTEIATGKSRHSQIASIARHAHHACGMNHRPL
jgi:hypothetical protein